MANLSRLIIVENGDAHDDMRRRFGNISDWIRRALGQWGEDAHVVRPLDGSGLPNASPNDVIILSGSAIHVSEAAAWMDELAFWVRDAIETGAYVFGICFGHQLLAKALGGDVGFHPRGRAIGMQDIRLLPPAQNDPVLRPLPRTFRAHASHSQTVLKLPPGAEVLAVSEHDPHQIVRYCPRAISTQFHPEFTPEISRSLLSLRQTSLREEGFDAGDLSNQLEVTPEAHSILLRFVDLARDQEAQTMSAKFRRDMQASTETQREPENRNTK